MSQANPGLEKLRQIKVPDGLTVSKKMVDELIANGGAPPTQEWVSMHVLGSLLEVVNYLGHVEATLSGFGQQ
jgi:hypothetical protein